MKFRRPIAAISTLAAILALTACGGGGGGGGGGGTTGVSSGGSDKTLSTSDAKNPKGNVSWCIGKDTTGAFAAMVKQFNDANPNATVKLIELPTSADQQRAQQVQRLRAKSTECDILGIDPIWMAEYVSQGWLYDLTDALSPRKSQFIPSTIESAKYQGKYWAIPFNTNAGFLYYRTDLIDQPPTTWDQLCQMAEQAGQQNGIGGLIGQGRKYEGFVVNWLEYYWSAGGELYNDDNSEVLFDTDIATQTTEFMQKAMDDGCFAPGFNTATEEEARAAFQTGKAVFMRNWPYAYQLIQDEGDPEVANNFDIAPLPTFSGQGTISALGGFNNAVSAYSSNKDAAKEFVVWASTNPEVQKMLATDASVPPVLTSVYDELQNEPDMALLSKVLPDAKPRPPAPTWNTISVEMQDALFPAYNGDADPADASQSVADAFNESVE